MNKTKFQFIFMLMCTILITPLSCLNQISSTITPTSLVSNLTTTPTVEYNSENKTYWLADLNGNKMVTTEDNGYVESIQTNDLKRLQEVTPFTIIVPKYWPSDLEKYKPQLLEEVDIFDSNAIEVTIHNWDYHDSNNPKDIEIRENNGLHPYGNTLNPYSFYVSGIQVIEEPVSNSFGKSNSLLKGVSYKWTQNGVHFSVDIYGYYQGEPLKIIKSMIE